MTHTEIREAATDTHKHCSKCGQFQALDDFPKDARGLRARASWCRSCTAKYRSTWDQTAGAKSWRHKYLRREHVQSYARLQLIKRRYGVEAMHLEERRIAGAGCDVCGSTHRVCIDHCHNSGNLRGLLCQPCNQTLGFASDDPARLRALADYLERAAVDSGQSNCT